MIDQQLLRASIKYENLSKKFSQQYADYNHQYCSIYVIRLQQMETILQESIRRKWGDKYKICKLHKLSEQEIGKCIVIGTLFKDQKLKPSVLKQLAEGNQLIPQPILSHFTDESDVLFIEDEIQRYQLIGLEGTNLVTGISCALLGSDAGKGKFTIEDYVFAGYRPQIERPISNDSVFIVFLSGLDLVHHEKFAPNLELLIHWLSGLLGDPSNEIRKIARIIIAGNSIRTIPEKLKPTISMTSRITESNETFDAVKTFDDFLCNICQIVDVDVMPGAYDPSNHILPQKQMHFCMFPRSAVYKTLNQVSNPYSCCLDGVRIFGTSGQPVRDILRFSEIGNALDAMESCLKWNHWAPTAPDTLGCFPFYESDPFIIDDCPHVVFAGNQKEFATKSVQGNGGQSVKLISLPEFSSTFQAVVLDLKTLDCHSVVFKTG